MSHAIVMGGSIAGMCAAAALARNFDRVTVLERDLDPGPHARRGVPQGHHTHVLMSRGYAIMDMLFPGAFEAMARDGAGRGDAGSSVRLFNFGNWKPLPELGADARYQSRPLLEHHLRQNLARNPKLELRFGVAIDQPIHARGRVSGLRLRDGSELHADLIVDATGRGSHSSTWLEQWGYGSVPEQRVRVGLTYVSGTFEPTDCVFDGAIVVGQDAAVGQKRFGYCFPLENGRRVVTLAAYHGEQPPTEIGAFRKWAKRLSQPEIAHVLGNLELVGELHRFTYPEQVRRCYGLMQRLPEGYLVVGDAMCSLDPTFAQGMLVAAMQAEQIAKSARPGASSIRLQHRLYRLTDMPFGMTATEAHRWAETCGWKPALCRLQQAFFGKVFEAAGHDAAVYRTLLSVMHFLASPASLLRPGCLWRVLTHRKPQAALEQPSSPFAGELSSPALSRTGF